MEPVIDQKTLDQVALTRAEYHMIVERLGREPTAVELGMFGALWSEHCGYKNSKPVLRLLPSRADYVLQGPGENAGVIDIGDGLAVAMKVESHNHPSAIEPFQGAATGVGGIIRDIFTMGARPIALLDSLHFGPLDKARNKYLFSGVVAGIADYGNCLGVPTVGGEVEFADAYTGNPLVNVMAVGLLDVRKLVRAEASEPGNVLMLVGADTGRDGIHGATFASVQLDERSEERRPAVQVGNPFLEKLLIEACLEIAGGHDVIGMQDLGAAGITSAVVETADKGGWGAELDVLKVARREQGMSAYEIMLSESQERMLVVVRRGREQALQRIFERWGLHSDVVGKITTGGLIRVTEGERLVAEVPAALLTSPPMYQREGIRPAFLDELQRFEPKTVLEPANLGSTLCAVLASPTIASKECVYRQYDYMVQTNTAVPPGKGDAAVLRVKGTTKAIAITIDCNGRHCLLDPYGGGVATVAEAARNLVCVGAKPLAVTDCLNFGNPEKPEIYFQLEQAVRGIADACLALGTPVVSGNVSLYNETADQAINPSPVIGMLGLIEDVAHTTSSGFAETGDLVLLLGADEGADLGGSEYLAVVHGVVAGMPPRLDLEKERAVQTCCRTIVAAGLARSAHDCSDGGLAVALAESCIVGGLGARLKAPEGLARRDRWLFNEAGSRIVLSVPAGKYNEVAKLASELAVPLTLLGTVGGERFVVGDWIDLPLDDLASAWRNAIEEKLGAKA